jgi:hypothetical protein
MTMATGRGALAAPAGGRTIVAPGGGGAIIAAPGGGGLKAGAATAGNPNSCLTKFVTNSDASRPQVPHTKCIGWRAMSGVTSMTYFDPHEH